MLFKIVHTWSCIQIRRWKTRRFHFQWVHDLVTELLQYSSLACLMPIWQLCANLLIPNCLRSNLSYSPLAALELYVKITNSPFCAPQLILFQKRKHRVERLNTISTTNNKIQNGIRNLPQFLSSSVPQFFSDPLLLSLFRSLLYI